MLTIMLFYQEDEVTNRLSKEIESQIGASISLKEQLRNGTVGSGLYYLRKLSIHNEKAKVVNLNARCTFEKYKHGLLLRVNDHQKLYSVALPFQSIDHFEMSPGKEYIKPFPLSPM